MSAKRFKLDSEVGFIDTQKCGGDTMTLFEVVVELNKLNEENEQLKLNNKRYMLMVNANSDLNDEIYEQLKKTEKKVKELYEENQALKSSNMEYEDALGRLEEENEQLKKELRNLRRLTNELYLEGSE